MGRQAKAVKGVDAKSKAVLDLPMTTLGVRLTQSQLLNLDAAERLRSGSRSSRRLAAKLGREVQAQLTLKAEALALDARLAEIHALAQARGEDVIDEGVRVIDWVKDEDGVQVRDAEGQPLTRATRTVRATRLCGLLSLGKTGTLSPVQVQTGLAYRVLVEAAETKLKSGLAEQIGGRCAMSSSTGMVRAQLEMAYKAARLRGLEAVIVTAFGRGSREAKVLIAVAAEGRSLRSISSGGNANAANLASLVRALNVLADTLAATRPKTTCSIVQNTTCESGNA